MSKEHKPFMKNFFMKKGFMRKDMEKLNDRDYEEFLADEDAWKILDKYGINPDSVNKTTVSWHGVNRILSIASDLLEKKENIPIAGPQTVKIHQDLNTEARILLIESERRVRMIGEREKECSLDDFGDQTTKSPSSDDDLTL